MHALVLTVVVTGTLRKRRPARASGTRKEIDRALVRPESCSASSQGGKGAPKRDMLRRPSMRVNQTERSRRSREFEVNQSRLRANQIETMIAQFDRICADLGQQIDAEEKRARISDPTHFAYPTYAKAARERRAKLQRSADALKIELDKPRSEMSEVANPQVAA